MKIRDYLLLQEINNQDLNSAQWLTECFLESRSTKELYSTDEEFMLPAGIWIIVWGMHVEKARFEGLKPEYVKTAYDGSEVLYFFNVSD